MKQIRSLLKIDLPIYKKTGQRILMIYPLIVPLYMILQILYIKEDLYIYISNNQKIIDTTLTAELPAEHFSNHPFMMIFLMLLITCAVLPMLLIYTNYGASKSMYTLRRLPSNGMYLYLAKYIPGLIGAVLIYVLHLIFIFLYYGLYLLIIPTKCLPENCFYNYIHSTILSWYFPITNGYRLLCICFILLLLPALGMLLALLERSKKSAWLGLPIALIAIYYVFHFLRMEQNSLPVLMTCSVLTILSSIYYTNKIQII